MIRIITIIISKKRSTLMKRKLSGRPLHAIMSQAKRNRSRNSNSSGSDESNPSLKAREAALAAAVNPIIKVEIARMIGPVLLSILILICPNIM